MLYEVTVQWLSREYVLVEATDEDMAEHEALDLFRKDWSKMVQGDLPPLSKDLLVTDVSCVLEA